MKRKQCGVWGRRTKKREKEKERTGRMKQTRIAKDMDKEK